MGKIGDNQAIPVVHLDYYTGEVYGEYPSLKACSKDLDIPLSTIVTSFGNFTDGCCVGRSPKHELLLMKKSAYEMITGVRK